MVDRALSIIGTEGGSYHLKSNELEYLKVNSLVSGLNDTEKFLLGASKKVS